MSNIIKEQLNKLKPYVCEVDGKSTSQLTDDFTYVVFNSNDKTPITQSTVNQINVVFEDYIIHPYPGFDFHDKFNNGIIPPSKSMFGSVLKETEKMLYMSLSDDAGHNWVGWCPKKSCHLV